MDCHIIEEREYTGSETLNLKTEKEMYITDINKNVYNSKLAKGFDSVDCPSCRVSVCGNGFYLSNDPRQFDVIRRDYLPLDSVPITGKVKLSDIYLKGETDYKLGYNDYSNINDGQIKYYVDRSISPPFFNPVFSENVDMVKFNFKDPMDSVKPEYIRKINEMENPATRKLTNKNLKDCNSFIGDTQTFREDLTSFQMGKMNRQKWSSYMS